MARRRIGERARSYTARLLPIKVRPPMKPIETTPADYTEMVELFRGETDRGAAVLAGSHIENFLGLYLRSFMVDQSLSDKIFGADGSLCTFSQRIDFAGAFGFLPQPLCAELHLIRKIRNYFAHHPKNACFSLSPVREWVASLRSTMEVELGEGKTFKLDDPRTAYLVSAGMFIIFANNRIHGYGNPEV